MLPDLPFVTSDDDLREVWRKHRRVLTQRYGVRKALDIIAGFSDEANEDRIKWYALGKPA